MNKHDFVHTPQFYKPLMEKPNYDHLKTEMIISFNCLQEKKVFLPWKVSQYHKWDTYLFSFHTT